MLPAIALSIYSKPDARSCLCLRLSDSVNSVEAWFDLLAGNGGNSISGGGSCIFSAKRIGLHGSVTSFVVMLPRRT